MNLHRFALVTLGRKIDSQQSLSGKFGKTEFHTFDASLADAQETTIVVIATATRAKFELSDKKELVVHADKRRECEHAIEKFANLISVANGVSRTISSPDPIIALSNLSNSAVKQLSACIGLEGNFGSRLTGDMSFELTDRRLNRCLEGRDEGVAILAESLSTSHGLSQFREYVRFFELAFARPFTDLRKALTKFLSTGSGGFSREEIESWIELRHPSSHADKLHTKTLAFERDTLPFVKRMEQAAYDVLFNKTKWHVFDTTRRKRYYATVSTTNGGNLPVIKRGKAAKITMQFLDIFGCYPLNMVKLNTLPAEWWYPPSKPFQLSGMMKVRR